MSRSPLARALASLALAACGFGSLASAQEVAPEPPRPRLDVVFAIDATGSMGDEIEQVKEHLRATARSITAASPRPDVRFGVVVYRDRIDDEPTRLVPLTRNVDAIHQVLANLAAVGGGDVPEDVDAGLTLAIREMQWEPAAAHMVFLVGDAGPQDYGVDREALLAEARRREIRVHTIQASGIAGDGVAYFRHWATATGGVAEVLTYRQNVVVDGTPRTVFSRGGETFVTSRALSDDEAALSFSELESRHLVARDASMASRSPAATGYAAPAPARASGARGRAPSAARAEMAPSAAAPVDSDVGAIIAREARREAADRGAAY